MTSTTATSIDGYREVGNENERRMRYNRIHNPYCKLHSSIRTFARHFQQCRPYPINHYHQCIDQSTQPDPLFLDHWCEYGLICIVLFFFRHTVSHVTRLNKKTLVQVQGQFQFFDPFRFATPDYRVVCSNLSIIGYTSRNPLSSMNANQYWSGLAGERFE